MAGLVECHLSLLKESNSRRAKNLFAYRLPGLMRRSSMDCYAAPSTVRLLPPSGAADAVVSVIHATTKIKQSSISVYIDRNTILSETCEGKQQLADLSPRSR